MSMFGFGKKKDMKETVREQTRELKKDERGMEREFQALEREEKKVIADIKRCAKEGQEAQARILAKQLVRLRDQKNRTMMMKGHVKGIASSIKIAQSNSNMATTAAKVSNTLGEVNAQMNPGEMRSMMQEYQKQSAQMEMKQEMIDEALDGMFDDDEIEEEADAVTQQVLDELGLNMGAAMPAAPAAARKEAVAEAEDEVDEDFAARLAALRS